MASRLTDEALPVRVDSKGRLMIPLRARKALDIRPGDIFFLQRRGTTLCYAKAENPFDGLAQHAIQEHRAGKTKNLRTFAEERGISLDAE